MNNSGLGFIGLGTIGRPVAKRLLSLERELVVYDRHSDAMEPLLERGALKADGVRSVAEQTTTILLSLPTPEIVENVVSAATPGLEAGDVVIDLSTSHPSVTEELAATLQADNISLLSAPVSGGKAGAESGSLSVIVGGDPEAYEACKPLFKTFSDEVLYVGRNPAHGHAAKLMNNFVSFACFAATAEAMILGEEIGIEMETALEVLNASSGRNAASVEKFPSDIVTEEFNVGFSIDLMGKDIQLYTDLAKEQRVPSLLGNSVREEIIRARTEYAGEDMTRLYSYIRGLANN